MPWFEIETEETARGVYLIHADDEDCARTRFERGDVGGPKVFETVSVETTTVRAIK